MMTKWLNDKNKFNKNNDSPISIGSEWTQDPKREYVCSYCNRTLSKLTDRSGLSPSWYCSSCQISTPEEDTNDLRGKNKIVTPDNYDNSSNPLATTKFKDPELRRKKVEIKGGLKALSQKGTIRIKDYVESKG
jgi:hypothetical protein